MKNAPLCVWLGISNIQLYNRTVVASRMWLWGSFSSTNQESGTRWHPKSFTDLLFCASLILYTLASYTEANLKLI